MPYRREKLPAARRFQFNSEGSYDASTAVEKLRIKVSLATGIPEDRCQRLSLSYIDPQTVRLEDWQRRESEGIKLIPHAGEILYRLKNR